MPCGNFCCAKVMISNHPLTIIMDDNDQYFKKNKNLNVLKVS